MEPIKVMVVDDSAFMRKLLSDFINDDPELHVIGIARSGNDALSKIEKWQPDVVTLDVELPDISGLTVLKKIMARYPVPVVMVSSLTQRGTQTTIDAMTQGAVDFVAKPSGVISPDLHKVKEELITKIKAAAKANVRLPTCLDAGIGEHNPEEFHDDTPQIQKLICIGSSTGGPRALQTVIKGLPKSLQAPVLVVQHLPPSFTATLAERLNAISTCFVKEAEDGEVLQNGTVYIAPGGYHMRLRKHGQTFAVSLDESPPVHGLRPAFDVLLHSLAQIGGVDLVLAFLTGMGSDGAEGLIDIHKQSQCYAIAESEETAVIFGMPKAAIRTGLVDAVLPLQEIAQAIVSQFNQ
ncbi:MAG: protein-glutamate methylesterase/protein-glutamine glutaminase [Tuberibacillus sp.]